MLAEDIVPGRGRVLLHALSQGLVNRSYRVTRDGHAYCLRVPIADGALIALDRAWEVRLLKLAGFAQLAPALRFHDATRGVLLSDWVNGHTWEHVDCSEPARIEQFAWLLRRVHALSIPAAARRMNPANWISHYEAIGEPGALRRRPAATACLNEWAAMTTEPASVCHGDLHALNLVENGAFAGASLRLLDWEYAHVGEAYWDLAGWCANGDLDARAKRRLLACYLGGAPSGEQLRRLSLMVWLYDYVCLQWSMLYLSRRPTGDAAARIAARAAFLDARLAFPAN